MVEITNVSQILGDEKTRDEVVQEIKNNVEAYTMFLDLRKEFQEQFLQFCMGVRGMKMTYDTFFKYVFDAEKHPERLSAFLSSLLGQKVIVKRALPLEHRRISDKGSLMILDIIVEFETGELADVEIQKLSYLFPGQRASCYSSDMVMRQYEREKSIRGEKFTYKDLKKVYTIIFMENSGGEFLNYPECYMHRGKVNFDSGIEIELLQEFYFVSLDIFFNIKHNSGDETIKNNLEAWLYFIGSDRPEDIMKLVKAYPEYKELYRDVCLFRYHPKEAIMMFSEALRQLDENTVQYMIDEMKQQAEVLKEEIKDLKQEAENLKQETEDLKQETEDLKQETEDLKQETADLRQEAEDLKQEAENLKQETINQKQAIEERDRLIAELKKRLAEKG